MKIKDYVGRYLKPPNPRDLWTYCGVWILDGVTTGLLYRLVFTSFMEGVAAAILADMTAFLLVALMLNRMGFSKLHTLIINVGGMLIAVANWPTLQVGLSTAVAIVFTIFGLVISLPLFCRGMETIRPTLK